jgi:hypothetical protein
VAANLIERIIHLHQRFTVPAYAASAQHTLRGRPVPGLLLLYCSDANSYRMWPRTGHLSEALPHPRHRGIRSATGLRVWPWTLT